MSKCLICNKDLSKGIPSAKMENGDYYLICPSCGNVHRVKVLNNGLTELERTSNDETQEIIDEIIEASKLFIKAGVDLMEYKIGIHSEKENIEKLNEEKLEKEEEEDLRKTYEMLPSAMKKIISCEDFIKDYIKFKKDIEEDPEAVISNMINSIIDKCEDLLIGKKDDEYNDDCDCSDCYRIECEYNPFNREKDKELCITETLQDSIPRFIIQGYTKEGEEAFAEAKNENDLNKALEEAIKESITISKINRVELSLVPVEFEKKYDIIK